MILRFWAWMNVTLGALLAPPPPASVPAWDEGWRKPTPEEIAMIAASLSAASSQKDLSRATDVRVTPPLGKPIEKPTTFSRRGG